MSKQSDFDRDPQPSQHTIIRQKIATHVAEVCLGLGGLGLIVGGGMDIGSVILHPEESTVVTRFVPELLVAAVGVAFIGVGASRAGRFEYSVMCDPNTLQNNMTPTDIDAN